VFTGDSAPTGTAPATLDFTNDEGYSTISPQIGQLFYVGYGTYGSGGSEQQDYVAPSGATHLYLGFADAYNVSGSPGWYGDNAGSLSATVTEVATGAETAVVGTRRSGGGGGISPGTCDCGNAEPVDTASGDFYESATDTSLSTFGPPVAFTRTYDALLAQQESGTSIPGPLGYGWTDNWGTSLSLNSDFGTTVTGDITLNQDNGSQELFVPPVSSACPSPYVGPGTTGTYCALPSVLGS
jgi:hypothetical protein